ncbi:MAG: sensor histidine kinase [Anaerolineae bacterium]
MSTHGVGPAHPIAREQTLLDDAARVLEAQSAVIVERWLTRVAEAIYTLHPNLSTDELRDGAPAIVRGVAEALRRGELYALEAPWTAAAREHAHARRAQGEEIKDLLREFQMLREEIWASLSQHRQEMLGADIFDLARDLDATLDTMATVSADAYGGELRRALERTARLQRVTAAFVPSLTPDEVAEVIVGQGIGALGGVGGLLVLLSSDGKTLELVEALGLPPRLENASRRLPLDAPHPLASAARSGEAQWFEDTAGLRANYPEFGRLLARLGYCAWVTLPLRVDTQTVGAVGLAFHDPTTFSADDRSLALSVAQQSAQALRRAQLFEAERRARAEAEAGKQQREDILRAVSHDLRNPLAAIQGQAQLLMRAAQSGALAERYQRSAQAILSSAQRMNTMIQDLVDAARSEAQQLQLHRQPVAMRQYLLDLLARPERAMDTRRIQVQVPEDLSPVWADPERLERILTNLLSNALKYSAPNTPVTVTGRQEDASVIVSVSDRGPGIRPEDMPRLFERYFRAQPEGDGLGLGLYVTRMLVEAHGGRIWAESREGEGSTFSFSLPVAGSANSSRAS